MLAMSADLCTLALRHGCRVQPAWGVGFPVLRPTFGRARVEMLPKAAMSRPGAVLLQSASKRAGWPCRWNEGLAHTLGAGRVQSRQVAPSRSILGRPCPFRGAEGVFAAGGRMNPGLLTL